MSEELVIKKLHEAIDRMSPAERKHLVLDQFIPRLLKDGEIRTALTKAHLGVLLEKHKALYQVKEQDEFWKEKKNVDCIQHVLDLLSANEKREQKEKPSQLLTSDWYKEVRKVATANIPNALESDIKDVFNERNLKLETLRKSGHTPMQAFQEWMNVQDY